MCIGIKWVNIYKFSQKRLAYSCPSINVGSDQGDTDADGGNVSLKGSPKEVAQVEMPRYCPLLDRQD